MDISFPPSYVSSAINQETGPRRSSFIREKRSHEYSRGLAWPVNSHRVLFNPENPPLAAAAAGRRRRRHPSVRRHLRVTSRGARSVKSTALIARYIVSGGRDRVGSYSLVSLEARDRAGASRVEVTLHRRILEAFSRRDALRGYAHADATGKSRLTIICDYHAGMEGRKIVAN